MDKQELLNKRLTDCDLSVRTQNSLKREYIETVRDLVSLSVEDLLKKRFWKKVIVELEDFLADNGLHLGMTIEAAPHIYNLHLTERQAKLLSYACDQFSRLICGQDWSFQELMEAAWERRCKEATGHTMDDAWDGGWHAMRHEAEDLCKQIKKRFWGLDWNALYGVHYDETADILFDLCQVIRHQLWLDRPDDDKSFMTVDASEAMAFSDEPLAKISRIK